MPITISVIGKPLPSHRDNARKIMLEALREGKLIQQDPAPDIRVRSYEEGGISYTIRYWVSRFERVVDCRDEVYSLIDDALRRAGSIAPYRRIQLVSTSPDGEVDGGNLPVARPAQPDER